jgi:hypothetical protein
MVAVVALVAARPSAAAESFESLARRVPRDANALVLIDVEQTLSAPLAREQGWARRLETAYVDRPILLPPEAKKLVLGAALQPDENFLSAWEIAVMELSEPFAVRAVARSEAGYVDDLSGRQAAITPRNAAFVDLGDNLLAVVQPAERQFVSRWAASAGRTEGLELSAYLQSALGLVNDRVQVLLAVDLTDVLAPRDIEAKLAETNWQSAMKGADPSAVASIVGALRGVALRLAVGEQCQARLQIDFDADVAPLGDAAKPLVMQALADLGFPAAELSKWKASLAARSIRLEGELSANAQRRVFSVIELPAVDLQAGVAAETSPSAAAAPVGESDMRESSLAYFQSTQSLLDDLRKGLKDTKSTSAWMERYARRIDELPSLQVDELLLDYSDKLAETLRIMSTAKRQAGIRYGVRATDGGGYYDGYDYSSNAYDQAAARSQARKEEMAVAADVRVEGWQLIDNATADIRRTLTKKYNVQF